jgi:hypothetical protein
MKKKDPQKIAHANSQHRSLSVFCSMSYYGKRFFLDFEKDQQCRAFVIDQLGNDRDFCDSRFQTIAVE